MSLTILYIIKVTGSKENAGEAENEDKKHTEGIVAEAKESIGL